MPSQGFNLQKFIISVVIVGVALIIGIYITSSIQTTTRDKNTAGLAVNESNLRPTTAGITLQAGLLVDGSCGTITEVRNGTTSGAIIALANFTQVGCIVYNATDLSATGLNYTATLRFTYPYTYSADTAASNASANITDALATGTSWVSILVVVGFATIILTMLTSGLSTAAVESKVPYY